MWSRDLQYFFFLNRLGRCIDKAIITSAKCTAIFLLFASNLGFEQNSISMSIVLEKKKFRERERPDMGCMRY